MAFFIGNSFCKLCQTDEMQLISELLFCIQGLIAKGLPPAACAIQSARLPRSNEIWIVQVPKGESLDIKQTICFKVNIHNVTQEDYDDDIMRKITLHKEIYKLRPDVNAILHTRNIYTISAISDDGLELLHAEAALILGDIPIVDSNSLLKKRSEVDDVQIKLLANLSAGEALRPIRTIVLKKNGVISIGACIHEARSFSEIIEEWARFKMIAKIYGGSKNILSIDQLRDIGARYARSIKFGGRQASSD